VYAHNWSTRGHGRQVPNDVSVPGRGSFDRSGKWPQGATALERLAAAGQLAFERLVELAVRAAHIVARPVVGLELDG